jgi:heme exporter protein C
MLILFFLYLGHMLLYSAFDDMVRGQRAACVLALVGVINLPIIKFSVDWWNTLHQPESIFRMGGPTIDPSMLWPLFTMALAFNAYFGVTLLLGMRAELVEARLRALQFGRAA